MLPLILLLVLVAALVSAAPYSSPQWHTVEWDAHDFVSFEGDFIVPHVPHGAKSGVPYVWPGLQGQSGALQAVLDGRTGAWSLGNGFFGASHQAHGDRFHVHPGESVHFSFSRLPSNQWTCTLSAARSTTQTFSLPTAPMTRAILAVSLTGVKHDFVVQYSNIVVTAATPAAHWCTRSASRGYDIEQYTIANAVADGNTCRISNVVLPSTA